jgi:hypothetical protein
LGPHEAIVRRIRVLDLQRRHVSAGLGCKRGERLVSATTAIGLYTALKPSISQLRGVRVIRSVVGGRIFVTADRVGLPLSVPVEVQVHALCTGAA